MLETSANEKYDLFVLVVTDIINSDSKILVVGAEKITMLHALPK